MKDKRPTKWTTQFTPVRRGFFYLFVVIGDRGRLTTVKLMFYFCYTICYNEVCQLKVDI